MGAVHPKVLTPDTLVARIAARQHGVVSLEQLMAAGLTPEAIKWRVRTGRLFRIHRGVYAVGHPGLTHHGRWKAATLALGSRAVLSHRSAAELWGLLRPKGGDPQVSLPYPASPLKRFGIRIYRSRSLAAARTTSREGIPVTMPAQTLADLARVATAAEVRRATRAAEKRGLPLDPGHVSDKTESDLERDFLTICRTHGVPEPEVNVTIGPYRVDFLWREERLVIETDGYIYHRGRRAMREDNDRDIDLELRGLRVTRIDDSRIAEDPAGVAKVVLGLLRLTGGK
jgi:very-short-patch-repair endonuclease